MNAYAPSITKGTFDSFYPASSAGDVEYGDWLGDFRVGTGRRTPATDVVSTKLLDLIAKRAIAEERFEDNSTTIESEGEDRAGVSLSEPGPKRDEALERLAELEAFAKGFPAGATRDGAIRSCRNAIAFVSFWPSDLESPDADIDEEGTISVEQFRPDGTLQAVFDFLRGEAATYAILTGTRIIDKGYLQIRDPREMAKVFRTIRSVAGAQT
jgi:hypothetical protein